MKPHTLNCEWGREFPTFALCNEIGPLWYHWGSYHHLIKRAFKSNVSFSACFNVAIWKPVILHLAKILWDFNAKLGSFSCFSHLIFSCIWLQLILDFVCISTIFHHSLHLTAYTQEKVFCIISNKQQSPNICNVDGLFAKHNKSV